MRPATPRWCARPSILPWRPVATCELFFTIHDPTTQDQQCGDVGTQYRSVIFAQTPEQRSDAEALIRELSRQRAFDAPIVTQLAGPEPFYPAEFCHQDYYAQKTATSRTAPSW